MKLKLKNSASNGEIQLSDAAFGRAYNEALVHQVVTAYMAAGRAGTKAQKNPRRSARRRQEALEPEGHGTGARRLDPQPDLGGRRPGVRRAAARFHAEGEPQDVPRRHAVHGLGTGAPGPHLSPSSRSTSSAPKTKLLIAKLKEFGLTRALILVEAYEEKLFLAARNVPYVEVMPVASLDPLSLIKHDKVLATVGALKLLEAAPRRRE
jgi:large subunit ribosomal protein L4